MKSPEESTIAPTPGIQTRRGMMVMLVSVLAFTINTLLLKYIGSGDHRIGPDVSLFFRALVGTVVVLVFFRGSRPVRIAPVFRNRDLVLRGISGLLGTAAYYWTIPSLGAGKATLICNTYVVFASVFALFSLGEKLNLTRLLWLLAAFAGISLLVGPGDGGGGFTFGFYEVLALFVPDLASLSWNETGVLALAATAASFGQLAMNEGYRCLTVTTGASVQMLWPVATTVGGWLLFGERFGALQWLGASLILAAIFKITAGSAAVRRN
jgi:drug/metabolite transporter (DMT)-like permease